MNGNSALLDSNILIYLSKNELPFSILDQFAALFVSVISYMEVLGYRFSNSKEENTEETTMEFNIFYKKKKDWFIGYIQEYPDYESQGRTLDELRENLIEIYNDINKGLVPDAEPFQLMEVAI